MPINKLKTSANAKAKADKQKSKTKDKKPVTTENTEKKTKNTKEENSKTMVARKTSKGSLNIDVYNTKGKVLESLTLPKEVFAAKINNQLMAQAVRIYLANQRQGTASTKTRGEVKGSSRKIYRQKGTGRARHGSVRAPIFVHGGVVFGPKPRDYSLKLPKKMKKQALFSALTAKLRDNEIKVVSGLEKMTPKTKEMLQVIKNLELESKNKNLILILSSKFENINRAARNIEGMTITFSNQLNVFMVLRAKNLLFTKASIEAMVQEAKEEK